MAHLDNSVSGAVRFFSFVLANGTVSTAILEGVDYSGIFEEPSAVEQIYAIFMNVLEVDDEGKVVDSHRATERAAQYIRSFIAGGHEEPPFEEWELELHM